MIGYAPFLGQVRLVNRSLGQQSPSNFYVEVYDQNSNPIPNAHVHIRIERLSNFQASKNTDSLGQASFELPSGVETREPIAITVTVGDQTKQVTGDGPSPGGTWGQRVDFNIPVQTPVAEKPSTSPSSSTPATTMAPTAPRSAGVPSWAYIAGGLAAAGLFGYLLFVKR
jgi:hypothetical protein